MNAPLPFRSAFPAETTIEERARAIAAILAVGLLRQREPRTSPAERPAETHSEFNTNELAVCGEKSVTVHAG